MASRGHFGRRQTVGQNTVAVADAVKERLLQIQKTLPPGFRPRSS